MSWILMGTRNVSDIKNYTPRCMVCGQVIKGTVYDFREAVTQGEGQEIEVGTDCAKRLLRGEEPKWRDI